MNLTQRPDLVSDRFGLVAVCVALGTAIALVCLSLATRPSILPYVVLISISSALVWALVRAAPPMTVRLALGVTIGVQLVGLCGYSAFEDDWFRFVWDGWQTLQTGTPYGKPPSDWFGRDGLSPSLSSVLDGVNHPDVPTIYGPVLQSLFAGVYAVAQSDPIGLRLMMVGVNLAIVALIMKRGTPNQAALYGWSPFVLAETVIHIHPDGIMALALLAGIVCARKMPILAGLLFGLAAGVKILALAAWPLLLRLGMRSVVAAIVTLLTFYGFFALQGPSLGFDSTNTFASKWLFNPIGFAFVSAILPQDIARWFVALAGIAVILIWHGRTRRIEDAPLVTIFGIVLFLSPAVNPWYLIWILPFAVSGKQVWPFAAMIALPLSYLTGQNLDRPDLLLFEVLPVAWGVQIVIISLGVTYDLIAWQRRKSMPVVSATVSGLHPIREPHIGIIIPALNEERSIGGVVSGLLALGLPGTVRVYVGDNGSDDATAQIARDAGATVISEPKRGYGAACLAALGALPASVNIVLFVDADGSDVLAEAHKLVEPIKRGLADMVIGSRALGVAEKGSLSIPQRFGNRLATFLMWLFWGTKATDLGPFRAIRRDTLDQLAMADRDFGWTVEMQVKAARLGKITLEQPADYRRRLGVSKISGTIKGVVLAGTKILYVIGREAFLR
jgi:Glycosyl transferase family 2